MYGACMYIYIYVCVDTMHNVMCVCVYVCVCVCVCVALVYIHSCVCVHELVRINAVLTSTYSTNKGITTYIHITWALAKCATNCMGVVCGL